MRLGRGVLFVLGFGLAAAGAAAKSFALSVGISQYKNAQAMPWLKYAHRDAELFAAHMATERGGKADRITVLINEKATRTALLAALNGVLRDAGPNDAVYLFFSA